MILGITVWNGIVAPVFDVSEHLLLIDTDNPADSEMSKVSVSKNIGIGKIGILCEYGVKELICGAISKPALLTAESNGIRVYSFVSGDTGSVIKGWRDNRLDDRFFRMPGCGRVKGAGCRGRKRGEGGGLGYGQGCGKFSGGKGRGNV